VSAANSCRHCAIGSHAAVVAAPILPFFSGRAGSKPAKSSRTALDFYADLDETQPFAKSAAAKGESKEPEVPWRGLGRGAPA